MNRRQLFKRGAMAIVGAALAPLAALGASTGRTFHSGGIVDINPAEAFAMLHPGDSILPRNLAEKFENETDFFIRTDLTPVGCRGSVMREISIRIQRSELTCDQLPKYLKEMYLSQKAKINDV